MDLIRSWLFVPGHRQRMIDKAFGLNADAMMLDIEDGVAPNEKDAARKNIAESLGREKAPGSPARYVRINAIGHARIGPDGRCFRRWCDVVAGGRASGPERAPGKGFGQSERPGFPARPVHPVEATLSPTAE